MPSDFAEARICATLGITYTELLKEPADWVVDMIDYHDTKDKADNHQRKMAENAMQRAKR